MEPYNTTDQQLHLLCQLITKANRTYVPKKDDDSHTNLYFDSICNRIVGRWIGDGNEAILFTISLKDLKIEVLNKSLEVVKQTSILNEKVVDMEDEVEVWLPDLGLSPEGFRAPLHFEIPSYPFEKDAFKEIPDDNVAEWIYYRRLANHLCVDLLNHAGVVGEVRIWPHHFDTGIYFELDNIGIGFGLAMEDVRIGSPNFYLSGYSKSRSIDYSNLTKLSYGHWEIHENWKGAILPLSELEVVPESERYSKVASYMEEAYEWYISL